MRYCVPYYKNFKYMEEVDEVIVPYIKEDVNFIKSLTSKEKLINGTVIIHVQDIVDFYENECIGIFKGLKVNYPEVKFKLKFAEYSSVLDKFFATLVEHEIPFFFEERVRSWDVFHGLIDIGVSDIYIVEELGFSLNKLGPIAHAKNVSIRCFANVAQSMWERERSIKSFFVRPEDVPIYEPYVDVLEFFGTSQQIYETLYRVYAISKKWFGQLNELIIGLDSEVDSRTIPPSMFAKYRTKCEKRCLKGSTCDICNRFVDVAANFEENGLIFKY